MNNLTEQPGIIVRKMSRLALVSFILCILMLIIISLDILLIINRLFEGDIALLIIIIGGPIFGLSSIVTGSIAINQIKKSNKTRKGLGLSIVGIIVGSLEIMPGLLPLLLIIFMSISEKYHSTAPIITITPNPTFTPQDTSTPIPTYTFTPTPTIDPILRSEIDQFYAECTDPEKCINAMVEHGWKYDLDKYLERFGNTSIPTVEEAWSQEDRVCMCTMCSIILADGLAQHGYPRTFLSLFPKDPQTPGHMIYVYQDSKKRYQFYELLPGNPPYHKESSATTIGEFFNFYNDLHSNVIASYTYYSMDSAYNATIIKKGP